MDFYQFLIAIIGLASTNLGIYFKQRYDFKKISVNADINMNKKIALIENNVNSNSSKIQISSQILEIIVLEKKLNDSLIKKQSNIIFANPIVSKSQISLSVIIFIRQTVFEIAKMLLTSGLSGKEINIEFNNIKILISDYILNVADIEINRYSVDKKNAIITDRLISNNMSGEKRITLFRNYFGDISLIYINDFLKKIIRKAD